MLRPVHSTERLERLCWVHAFVLALGDTWGLHRKEKKLTRMTEMTGNLSFGAGNQMVKTRAGKGSGQRA